MAVTAPLRPLRVFGWLADRGGCGHYRIMQPLGELQRRGLVRARWDTVVTYGEMSEYDVVIGQRVSAAGASQMWRRLAADGKHLLVFEVDDDLWHVEPDSPVYNYYHSRQVQDTLATNIHIADLVTVTTEPLAKIVRRFNRNVVVLPNYVDERLLGLQRQEPQSGGAVRVGWAGSGTHKPDFDHAGEPLRRALRALPDAWMCFFGADYSAGFPADRVKFSPWEAEIGLVFQALLDMFDVALAPLKPCPFNRSKSHLKALEYHALGLPGVYSAGWSYNGFVRHGETGWLVRHPSDWGRHLRTLVNDAEARQAMGKAARELAAQWTIQQHAIEWLQAYRRAICGSS